MGAHANIPKSIAGQQWAKTLKINNAKVIQFSGFSKVNEFDIHNDPEAADDANLIGEPKP